MAIIQRMTLQMCFLLSVTSSEITTTSPAFQALAQTEANHPLSSTQQLLSSASRKSSTTAVTSSLPTQRPERTESTLDAYTSTVLSLEQCQAAVRQCQRSGSAAGSTTFSPDDIILKTKFQESMRELRAYITRLIDIVEEDVSTPLYTVLCPTTTTTPRCSVSDWSQWSAPFGFGVQERRREITQYENFCPEIDYLVERITNNNTTAAGFKHFQDVDLVSTNLYNSFLNATQSTRDVLVLVDSSGSISQAALAAKREGLKTMVNLFCDELGNKEVNTRMAVVQFSRTPVIVHRFLDEQSPEVLRSAMDAIKPLPGLACTGESLNVSYYMFDTLQGARLNSSHYTLLITDGHSNCREDVSGLALRLQERSTVLAVAIGVEADARSRQELAEMVSDKDDKNIFSLANFRDFRAAMQTLLDMNVSGAC